VDDELIARQVLREELESIRDVKIIGEAGDGDQQSERGLTLD
jgi:hypothetical protein